MISFKPRKKLWVLVTLMAIAALFVVPAGAAPLQDGFTTKVSTEVLEATTNGASTS